MNTPNASDTPAAPAAALPDHTVAANELAAFFATLGIRAEVSGAHAAVEPPTTKDEKGWAHVGVIVTFTRDLVCDGPRKCKAVTISTSFRMGTGLADWKSEGKKARFSPSDLRDVEHMTAYGSRLTPESQAAICAKHLSAFVKRVNPAEVLAGLCRDGQDASGQSFESWAGDYGYDTDSRKAEDVYRACQKAGDDARKLLSHAPGAVDKLAELASRL